MALLPLRRLQQRRTDLARDRQRLWTLNLQSPVLAVGSLPAAAAV
jgi:hypothetical protein